MNTRISSLSILIPALALAASAYADPTLRLEAGPGYGGTNPYQAEGGGEFTAFDSSGIPSGYASDALLTLQGQEGFETFCLLPDVDFNFSETYGLQISPDVYVPTISNNYASAVPEPLSVGAAWLYSQFATGQLQDYDYANTDLSYTRINSASDLQKAIWYYEGQISNPDLYDANPDPFLNQVEAKFGSDSAGMMAETNNEFQVNVMDAYLPVGGPPTTIGQPTLIYTGPDTASTAALLGAAVLALALISRRTSRQQSLA